jgi:hypothetical protein
VSRARRKPNEAVGVLKLQEIVRLQIESGEDQEVIDSVDGFDSPDCAARVLMGIARGLTARKHAGVKEGG